MSENSLNIPSRAVSCDDCGGTYDIFKACQGKGKNPTNRGRVMQNCKKCRNTIFYTDPYTTYAEAEAVAAYLNLNTRPEKPSLTIRIPARPLQTIQLPQVTQVPTPLPLSAMSAQSVPAITVDQVSQSQVALGLCKGLGCMRRNAKKYHSKCLYTRCATCCDQEYVSAIAKNQFRRECGVHFERSRARCAATTINPAINITTPTSSLQSTSIPNHSESPSTSDVGMPKKLYSHSLSDLWSATARQSQLHAEQIRNARHARFSARTKTQSAHTIKLVIWHMENAPPIRFVAEASSFPKFTLQSASWLVTQLNITEVDALLLYNPATLEWDLHHLQSTFDISKQTSLLYKLPRSILNDFPDNKCPQLADEIKKIKSNCITETSNNTLESTAPQPLTLKPLASALPLHKKEVFEPSDASLVMTGGSRNESKLRARKEWPTDFTVREISDGLRFIRSGQMERRKTEVLFREVFQGARFVKSTFNKTRTTYELANQDLKDKYLAQEEEGLWRYFRRDFRRRTEKCQAINFSNGGKSSTPLKRSRGYSTSSASDSNPESLPDATELLQYSRKGHLSKRIKCEGPCKPVEIKQERLSTYTQKEEIGTDGVAHTIYIIDSD